MKKGFTQVIMAVIGVIVAAILTFNVALPAVQSSFGTQGNATVLSSSGINYTAIPGGYTLAQLIPLLLVVGVVLVVVGGYLYMRK